MGKDVSITFMVPEDMLQALTKAQGILRRDRSEIIRSCIRLTLHRLADPATLIDLIEAGELGHKSAIRDRQDTSLMTS